MITCILSHVCCSSCSLTDKVRHLLFPVQHVQFACFSDISVCLSLVHVCQKKRFVVAVQFHGGGAWTSVPLQIFRLWLMRFGKNALACEVFNINDSFQNWTAVSKLLDRAASHETEIDLNQNIGNHQSAIWMNNEICNAWAEKWKARQC